MLNNAQLKLPYEKRIQVDTNLKALPQVLAWFEQFNQPPVPYSDWLECQLALAEAFTNAVRHAHAHKAPDTPIDIEVIVYSQTIELKVWDYGSGFDLSDLAKRPIEADYREHGRGIKIMQRIASELNYQQVEQRNCLQLIKHFSEDPNSADQSGSRK
ncbi:ATP-binding protein [Egbenema bharatensis]|uniref:ATP-binding protein n=1 Tax=Egbenema bharatensis TaxID=3463334 RepID=UPI003A860EFD